jgi:hypothetical protein
MFPLSQSPFMTIINSIKQLKDTPSALIKALGIDLANLVFNTHGFDE